MTMDWVRQQDYDTESLRLHGCALAAGTNAMVKASGGEWGPTDDDGTAIAKVLLDRSGATAAEFNARGITSRELYKALDATANDHRERMPIRLRAFHGWLVADMLEEMVKAKGCLMVAVRNRVLVKAGKTRFPGFNGGHWGVVTARVGSDVRWIAGEKSPIVLPIRTLTDAADQFGDKTDVGLSDDSWGDGRGEAILMYPWLTWKQGYSAMKVERNAATLRGDAAIKQRDAARENLAATQAALAACEAGQGDPDAIKAARQSGIDAATERARTTPNP
jgi:hypothetical protein